MDLQSISWNLRKQDYLESSKNTLCILSTGLNNINRQDLIFLAYEFILSLEFKKDQAKWIKVPSKFFNKYNSLKYFFLTEAKFDCY